MDTAAYNLMYEEIGERERERERERDSYQFQYVHIELSLCAVECVNAHHADANCE